MNKLALKRNLRQIRHLFFDDLLPQGLVLPNQVDVFGVDFLDLLSDEGQLLAIA